MDEEDMAEAEEARKVQTTETFAGFGSDACEASGHDALLGIMKSSGETMGVKLLKKMGWREGQGVGPKIRRSARLHEVQDMDAEANEKTHLFAPENSTMISLTKKNDRKGLGFQGESKLVETPPTTETSKLKDTRDEDEDAAASSGFPASRNNIKKKKHEPKGGFGVGVLNDDGSDDEDPYAMGPQISYNHIIGGEKKKKKKLESVKSSANPLLNSKPIFISQKVAAGKSGASSRRCHDGRLPLDGFVLTSNRDAPSAILPQDGKYPPPDIPHGWKSSKVSSASIASTPEISKHQHSTNSAVPTRLSPKSRAALLGETALPGKSVFDYLTPGARTRIATATNNDNLPPALNEASAYLTSRPKTLTSLVPPLARETAQAALGRGTAGWMPYAEDLGKRARYRKFLEISAGLCSEDTLPDRPPGSTNDDWVNEMNEFVRAAQVFKPMTGAMASRFTSSNVKLEGAANPSGEAPLVTRSTTRIKTPAEEAAALGMYGPLTRSSENFYPTRLLCKRFNVQPPAHVQPPGEPPPGSGDSANTAAINRKNLDLVGKRDMDDLRRSTGGMRGPLEASKPGAEGEAGTDEVTVQASQEVVTVDPERNEALEGERPGEAVFRAIFGSDSEED